MADVCVNPNMKNPPLSLGVISAPDEHPRAVLYDKEKVQRDLYKTNKDIYEQRKKASNLNRQHKFPISVIILSLATLALSTFAIIKRFVKK